MKLPKHALDNIELMKYAHLLNIPHFRSVFMTDNLPKRIKDKECGIINLDSSKGPGTQWTAYVKKKNSILYFDSYGNLRPPQEIVTYFYSDDKKIIQYKSFAEQKFKSHHCGQLCLQFLYKSYR